ncbi:MAG: HAMP domain-containing sensor histidine kinase, partial [Myxococcota bacterium]
KQLPIYWCMTLALAWLISPAYGFLASKGHGGDFGLWLTGVLFTAVLIDLQGFVRLVTGCTLVGWLLYMLLDGRHGLLQSLSQLPAWTLFQGCMSIVVVSLFSRSREEPLQQQLQAYKIKEGCTAHDLPAPLNSCQNSAKKLQEHMPDLVNAHKKLSKQDPAVKPKRDETYQELLQLPSKIDKSAQRGKDFVHDMLDEAVDPFKATQEECSIAQCVQDALDYAEISVEELGRVRWRGGDFKVRVRPYLMSHGIYNGTRNALKHGKRGGIVEIWACQEEEMNVLIILNEGSIDSDKLPFVQEAFVSGSKEGQQGHGVGLSFCKLVAQLAGGDICLQSTPEGGVCLRFEFPINSKKRVKKTLS